jgi:hypothetical protein
MWRSVDLVKSDVSEERVVQTFSANNPRARKSVNSGLAEFYEQVSAIVSLSSAFIKFNWLLSSRELKDVERR